MENKTINTQNLEAVTGSKKYSANWNIGEKVSISSAMPQCPDCGKPLLSGGNYPERGMIYSNANVADTMHIFTLVMSGIVLIWHKEMNKQSRSPAVLLKN